MQIKFFKPIMLLMLLIPILSFGACSGNVSSSSNMEFSFNTSTPSNSNDEKTIYINNDMAKLELNCELKVDSGEVEIQVQNTSNNDAVWDESYSEDTNFTIELNDLKAGSEYLLKISTTQSKKVNLKVTSNDKLVKDKEKPEKYNVD